MKLTATEFRKTLFRSLDHALQGHPVEVTYKGETIRMVITGSTSKLARAKRQNTLLCDPDAIVHSDPEFLKRMERQIRKGWKNA